MNDPTVLRVIEALGEATIRAEKVEAEVKVIKQVLGTALGHPRYCDDLDTFPNATEANGVCTGPYTAETLAMETADRIKCAEFEVERLREAISRVKWDIGQLVLSGDTHEIVGLIGKIKRTCKAALAPERDGRVAAHYRFLGEGEIIQPGTAYAHATENPEGFSQESLAMEEANRQAKAECDRRHAAPEREPEALGAWGFSLWTGVDEGTPDE